MTTPHDPTIANTAIWSHYLTEQWGRWLAPLGGRADAPASQIVEGTAARVASFLTLVAAGPIAWLYATSAAERGAIVTELPQRREAAVVVEEAAAA
jgi:hypothetical protein